MPAKSPEEVYQLFKRYFSAGDLDSLMSLYDENATMVPQPGQTVSGKAAIREALGLFLSIKGEFRMEACRSISANDVALLFSKWILNGTTPDGSNVSLGGSTSDVVRKQADGTWLFVIDNPFGDAGVS
jgi:uncharacterized protein (TIGR02246 family)